MIGFEGGEFLAKLMFLMRNLLYKDAKMLYNAKKL